MLICEFNAKVQIGNKQYIRFKQYLAGNSPLHR